MTSVIYIDIDGENTKVAITESGRLAEFYFETPSTSHIVGNIYKAKVVNTVPGMQAAFCNIGLDKNAYMSNSDSLSECSDLADIVPDNIMFAEGEELMVQVVKDATSVKGARITPNISLPGRLLVMTPKMDYIAVSRRIEEEKAREKLINTIKALKPDGIGYIVRTLCAEASRKDIEREIEALNILWESINKRYEKTGAAELIHRESDVILRTLRDSITKDVTKIIINNEEKYNFIKEYLKAYLPKQADIVSMYKEKRDMLTHYGITACIDKITKRKVNLKCGGYLVIDKTEALTVIDVNSGKYTGDNCLEETVYKVNMEACSDIAHQIRLRNISGIIIIDFIDMLNENHRESVLDELKIQLKKDRVKTNVAGMTKLGLVELTRKKTRNEVGIPLTASCPYCDDDNRVYSAEYLATKIKASLIDTFIEPDPKAVLIFVSDKIFKELNESRFLAAECEDKWSRKRIYLAPDERLHMSTFRIQMLPNGIVLDLPDGARMLY